MDFHVKFTDGCKEGCFSEVIVIALRKTGGPKRNGRGEITGLDEEMGRGEDAFFDSVNVFVLFRNI